MRSSLVGVRCRDGIVPSAHDVDMPSFTVTTALPYEHADGAAMGLRAQLRLALLDAGILSPVDWSQMVVAGPEEHRDQLGRVWHGYWATITVDDAEDAG
jgi:hypothetical protein